MTAAGGHDGRRRPVSRLLRRSSAPVHGTLFTSCADPVAGVVVIGGSGGSEPSYVAEPLAREGFAALSVAYFSRPGLPTTLSGIDLEYFVDALQVLCDELGAGIPVAMVGMSRGSEAALLTAIHLRPDVRGVAVSVPTNVVHGGIPDGPAWLLDGRPLPWAERVGPGCEDPQAVIPVERVPGALLLVAAGADTVWPSAAMARAIAGRLDQHRHPGGHVLLEYPEAAHGLGYLVPDLPTGVLPPGVDDDRATRAGRHHAWPRLLAFLSGLAPA